MGVKFAHVAKAATKQMLLKENKTKDFIMSENLSIE